MRSSAPRSSVLSVFADASDAADELTRVRDVSRRSRSLKKDSRRRSGWVVVLPGTPSSARVERARCVLERVRAITHRPCTRGGLTAHTDARKRTHGLRPMRLCWRDQGPRAHLEGRAGLLSGAAAGAHTIACVCEGHLDRLVAGAEISTRVRLDALKEILADGRFKTRRAQSGLGGVRPSGSYSGRRGLASAVCRFR